MWGTISLCFAFVFAVLATVGVADQPRFKWHPAAVAALALGFILGPVALPRLFQ